MEYMTRLTRTSINTGSVANPVPGSKRVKNAVYLLGFRFQVQFRAKSSERHIQPQAREVKVHYVMSQGSIVDTTTSWMFSMCEATCGNDNNSPTTEPLSDLLFGQKLFILRPTPGRQRLRFGVDIWLLSRGGIAPTQQHQITGGPNIGRCDR